jgi:hypothetical protein
MASKNFEKSRKREHQKTDEKAKKMKKFLYRMVQRTRGRDTNPPPEGEGANESLREFHVKAVNDTAYSPYHSISPSIWK